MMGLYLVVLVGVSEKCACSFTSASSGVWSQVEKGRGYFPNLFCFWFKCLMFVVNYWFLLSMLKVCHLPFVFTDFHTQAMLVLARANLNTMLVCWERLPERCFVACSGWLIFLGFILQCKARFIHCWFWPWFGHPR